MCCSEIIQMRVADGEAMNWAHYQYVLLPNPVGFIMVMMTLQLVSPVAVDSLPPAAGSFISRVLCHCIILITYGSFPPQQ